MALSGTFFYLTVTLHSLDKQLISHVFLSPFLTPALSNTLTTEKHVQFTALGLSPPTDELIIQRFRSCEGKLSPWRSPTTSSLGCHLVPLCHPSLPPLCSIWHMQVWICPPPGHFREQKQKPKQRLGICIRKCKHHGAEQDCRSGIMSKKTANQLLLCLDL